jgi:hypothetical protein
LILYGAAAGPAATTVLAYRVVSTAVPLVLGAIALRGLHRPMPKLAAATEISRVTGGRWSRPSGCRARERHQLDPT